MDTPKESLTVCYMIELSPKWLDFLMHSPETGMGYQIVSVVLKDGTQLDRVVVIDGKIASIKGRDDIPFISDDIQEIIVTHDKWDFNREK
jgi:hypothetical protein